MSKVPSRMNQRTIQHLLEKYRRGQCTPEELNALYQWYDSFDEETPYLSSLNDRKKKKLESAIFGDIQRHIQQGEQPEKVPGNPVYWYRLAGIAAALLLTIGLSWLLMRKADDSPGKTVVSQTDTRPAPRQPERMVLPDGSIAWVKAGSQLAYPTAFSGNTRTVQLEGDAFFEVVKDSKHPFIVQSGGFNTRVLGTSFNVRSYAQKQEFEVTVVTGKVAVSEAPTASRKGTKVVLLPNQKVVFKQQDGLLVVEPVKRTEIVDLLAISSLKFRDAPLREVIQLLNRRYHVTITLQKASVGNCTVTADLTDETLKTSLDIIATSVEATYQVQGDNIILAGEGC